MKGHPWIAAFGVFFVVGPLAHVTINLARGKTNADPIDAVDAGLMLASVLASVAAYQRFK